MRQLFDAIGCWSKMESRLGAAAVSRSLIHSCSRQTKYDKVLQTPRRLHPPAEDTGRLRRPPAVRSVRISQSHIHVW